MVLVITVVAVLVIVLLMIRIASDSEVHPLILLIRCPYIPRVMRYAD